MIKATISLFDDGLLKGVYELKPTRERRNGHSTTYGFDFEYAKLDEDAYFQLTREAEKMRESRFKYVDTDSLKEKENTNND